MKTSDEHQTQFLKILQERCRKDLESILERLSRLKTEFGDSHPTLASVYRELGSTYTMMMDYDKAGEVYNVALSLDVKEHGKVSEPVFHDLWGIANSLVFEKDLNVIVSALNETISVAEKVFGENDARVADLYNKLGQTYQGFGDYSNAERCHLESLRLRKKRNPEYDIDTGTAHYGLAKAYMGLKELSKAKDHTEECDNLEERSGENSYMGAVLQKEIWAEFYAASGLCSEAASHYAELISLWEKSTWGTSAAYHDVFKKIAECYRNSGDDINADKYDRIASKYKEKEN
jgi:tetratricopeptide (TPR) repeat protein